MSLWFFGGKRNFRNDAGIKGEKSDQGSEEEEEEEIDASRAEEEDTVGTAKISLLAKRKDYSTCWKLL